MIGSDKRVNRFLESIKSNLEAEQQARPEHVSHVVINRAVRCTIIVGQPPQSPRRSDRHKVTTPKA